MALPVPSLQLKTYDDLLAIPEDGHRYELIFGEITMSLSALLKHQWASLRLSRLMLNFVEDHQLGTVYAAATDVKLSPYNVVQPDIFFLSLERLDLRTRGYVDGAPDLVVELLSPSNRAYDLVRKAALYAQFGVPEYWIVDPESEQLVVNVLRGGQYVDTTDPDGVARSTVLPGFAVSPADLFVEPEWMTKRTT